MLALLSSALACADRAGEEVRARRSSSPVVFGYRFDQKFAHGSTVLLRHQAGGERIDLTLTRDVSPAVAARMILERSALFESTFVPAKPGYPGQHTRSVEYPERFKPRRIERELEGGQLLYFLGFATANHVHGASSEDLAVHRSLYGLLHCRERAILVEIDYFTGLDQEERLQSFVERLGCDLD